MNRLNRTGWSVSAAIALTFLSLTAFAHDYAKNDIVIDHPWARPTMSAVVPAAVYFEIVNNGAEDDRLVSASTERAKHVELHLTEMNSDGVAKMRMVKEGVATPAHEKTSMETGAYHVMLIGLGAPLQTGEEFLMNLTFEKAGEIEVLIKVEDRQKEKANQHQHH